MSILFLSVLVTHVVVAVLGLGSVLSVAILAAAARRTAHNSAEVSAWLRPLLSASAFSLGTMLVTGILMDFLTGGAFHHWWWFRASAMLLVIAGILQAWARRAVVRLDTTGVRDAALRRVQRIAYGVCGLIATIAVLMETKPF